MTGYTAHPHIKQRVRRPVEMLWLCAVWPVFSLYVLMKMKDL